jgi:formylglycine-generating enzyme required for sulfatase activity
MAATLGLALAASLALVLVRPMTRAMAPDPTERGGDGTSRIQRAGSVFRDCPIGCPEMVVVPAGYGMIGAVPGDIGPAQRAIPGFIDNESPRHEVRIGRAFALGRYDVTREEYGRFVAETRRLQDGCWGVSRAGVLVFIATASWRTPGFSQTARDPVVCVSWVDAVAYTRWLVQKTGQPYRLPTEAEWEYAVRAGDEAERITDQRDRCRLFNGADADYGDVHPGDPLFDVACRDGFAQTSPVGSFPADGLGLFDMLGNVGQWMADCYHDSYDGAPTDGSAWIDGDCPARVGRGGSWSFDSANVRVSLRGPGAAGERFDSTGFRIARDLTLPGRLSARSPPSD